MESNEQTKLPIIGRVAATKMQGNNSKEFYFWIDPDTELNPLDLIVVEEKVKLKSEYEREETEKDEIKRKVYAQILDITSYTDAESFLEVFASTDFGNVQLSSDIERVAFSVAKAQVLRTSNDIRMPVKFGSAVYLADKEAIEILLRTDEVAEAEKLPIGYVEQSNGIKVPVFMEASFLTGPDGAHLNVSGKSRLAAKTSYTLFLLSSILQNQKDTAIVIFNVKGSDLLQIDKFNNLFSTDENNLNDRQKQKLAEIKDCYQSMNLQAQSFKDVVYFLPSLKRSPIEINADLRNLPTPGQRDITQQPDNYYIYRYTLEQVRGKLRLLLASKNLTDPQEQFVNALDNDNENSFAYTSNNFSELSQQLNGQTGRNNNYLNAGGSTVRVVQRLIDNVTDMRTTGVFDYERSTLGGNKNQLPSDYIKNQDKFKPGQVLVVDIGSINDIEKQWVFGDVLKAVEERKEMGDINDPLKKVIIFVDELNKYAPSGASSPLINDVIDVTARGGALGVILFGAEQFASRINTQVYGNCANKAFGLTDATEASSDPYRSFPKEIKDRLSELQRGELVLNFDFFGQPLRVKFPPPACRKQEDANIDNQNNNNNEKTEDEHKDDDYDF